MKYRQKYFIHNSIQNGKDFTDILQTLKKKLI
jgi:hypothetical protein